MDIEQVIKSRHSVRKYLVDKTIEKEKIEKLNELIDECNSESGLKIKLVLEEKDAFTKFALHYGKLNAPNFISICAGTAGKDANTLAGYYGEKIVLLAQELGLNTCWTALTFSKGVVQKYLDKNDKLIIVIAIGYGETQGVPHKSKTLEKVSKTTTDLPNWYKNGIDFALFAPTAINQQQFVFELKEQNKVKVSSKLGPCSKIDLGIVKLHFELGAGRENFEWEK